MTRDEILAEYRKQAALGQFQGLTILQHEIALRKLCVKYQPKTLLDYGSGHGRAWGGLGGLRRRMGIEKVTRYDPAIPDIATKPVGKFDGVVCCDVLEHVVLEDVEEVIADLFSYASKFVFATVCCRPAKKLFPDLTNMHVTLMPLPWWESLFSARAILTAAGGANVPDWRLVESE